MPTQLVNKKKIEEASYPAVYFPKENRAVALGDKDLPSVSFAENGDAPYAIGTTRLPYSLYTEPEIQMFDPSDSYLIELKTGKRTLLRKKGYGGMYLSPSAKYAAYYNPAGLFVVFDRHEDAETYAPDGRYPLSAL
ncbi:MAG: hypothetical protein ACLR1G_08115 [Alistipes indistinctus]